MVLELWLLLLFTEPVTDCADLCFLHYSLISYTSLTSGTNHNTAFNKSKHLKLVLHITALLFQIKQLTKYFSVIFKCTLYVSRHGVMQGLKWMKKSPFFHRFFHGFYPANLYLENENGMVKLRIESSPASLKMWVNQLKMFYREP